MRFLWILLVLAACDAKPQAPAVAEDPEHPRMQPIEQERDLEICRRYVDRLCACAAHDASLVDQCDLAKGQPQAVSLHVSLLHGISITADGGEKHAELNPYERRMTEASLRNIVAACVASDAALDPKTCPRK